MLERNIEKKGLVMKKIESFKVDHRVLDPGIYVSRTDGDEIGRAHV